jgi:predicted Zn-dependent peptidase
MDIKFKKYVLDNDIKVIIIPLDTKLTHISANYLLGFNHETPDISELTHYYEHLLARLTSKKYKNAKYIDNEISKRGGYSNAYVDEYDMCVYINGLYKDLEFYMDILSNSIRNFYIDKKIAKKEKNAVVQELNNMTSDLEYEFDTKIFKYLHPKYFHMRDYKSHIKKVKKFTMKDIHKFIKNKICSKNLLISITCPKNKVRETQVNVKKYFGKIKRYNKCSIIYPILQYNNNKFKIIHVENKHNDNVIVRLYVCKKIEYLSKENIILNLLNTILFNFHTGIFYKILRTKLGLIYNIGMSYNIDIINAKSSYYYIYTQCEAKNFPIIVNEIIKILKTYKITNQDVVNAKNTKQVMFENKKFHNLTSFNNDYNIHFLFNKNFLTNKEYYKLFTDISLSDVKTYFETFKEDILNKGILFYYSKKNLNSNVDKYLKKSIIKNKYKMLYI